MLSIELMGGLGNQMFQIFTLISYSMEHNIPFIVEKKLVLPGPVVKRDSYWNNIFRHIVKNAVNNKINFQIHKEIGTFIYNQLPRPETDLKLFGYYQSYKYFDKNIDNILKILDFDSLKKSISSKHKLNYNNTIAMHFRFGDYLKLQHCHPVMKPEYFIKSLNHITSYTKKSNWDVLYIYEKDDVKLVNKYIDEIRSIHNNINYISCEHILEDWEQMLQMSLCRHNIIANSSFSWWSAYLNEHNDKIVCYPSIWFGPGIKGKIGNDLIPQTWIKI